MTDPANPELNWLEQYQFAEFTRAGDLVFLSGQVGHDEQGNPPEDPIAQYQLAFQSLSRVLRQAGLTPADIVDLTTFHTSYPQHMAEFVAVKAEFQGPARPAWTAVGVERLGMPGTLVEIKAIASAPR
ncbi:RidA family protein [Tomitella biformata]|uniref:RidA family protein n=1 Tax=Tomitella biformata TaxID=630403 RepID=UPI0004641B0D|nr:RidA family protein [Tomitella biformata]